ncbi:MAG: hypothetical protein AB8C84_03050 [Oligoflexales bacterium]
MSSESQDLNSLELECLSIGLAKMYEKNNDGLKKLVVFGKIKLFELESLPLKGFESNEILGESLNNVKVRDQYELTEFVQSQADLFYEKNSTKTIVLGHLPDTQADVWR